MTKKSVIAQSPNRFQVAFFIPSAPLSRDKAYFSKVTATVMPQRSAGELSSSKIFTG